ncbi:GntR family transcriptional regulator [Antricoccus suffuscus]|uniref:GntR family transcriptional regulator n=1 Tax=Antricoccus suffuscus TaxID=1629062 RepID=A0A2T0ZUC1_9ACTN|nr:GntR family transcriptional regulator [Antricoccus suffuscus]PRZ39688.1 GntR family transcriptional regulator [Antricoccus suffuscus]
MTSNAADGSHYDVEVKLSSTDRVLTELQKSIITGAIPIGTWLRHSALAKDYGVSRTPVREALRVLAAQGVVTIVPNRGARVNGPSSRDIRELGEVRSELQGLAAELAAERINDAQLSRMHHAWDAFRCSLDTVERTDRHDLADMWGDANEDFHSVIVEAAGNHQLSLTLMDLHRRMPRNLSFGAYAGNTHLLRKNLAEHDRIGQAIADHDASTARRLMAAHFKHANQATARWVESRVQDEQESIRPIQNSEDVTSARPVSYSGDQDGVPAQHSGKLL